MTRLFALLIACLAVMVGGAACASTETEPSAAADKATATVEEESPSSKPAKPSKPEKIEITAEMVIDLAFSDEKTKRDWCRGYELMGEETSWELFVEVYGDQENPSTEEVFAESASRC